MIKNDFKDVIKRSVVVMHHTDEIVPDTYIVSLYKRLSHSGVYDDEERLQIPTVEILYEKVSDHRGYAVYRYGGVKP